MKIAPNKLWKGISPSSWRCWMKSMRAVHFVVIKRDLNRDIAHVRWRCHMTLWCQPSDRASCLSKMFRQQAATTNHQQARVCATKSLLWRCYYQAQGARLRYAHSYDPESAERLANDCWLYKWVSRILWCKQTYYQSELGIDHTTTQLESPLWSSSKVRLDPATSEGNKLSYIISFEIS